MTFLLFFKVVLLYIYIYFFKLVILLLPALLLILLFTTTIIITIYCKITSSCSTTWTARACRPQIMVLVSFVNKGKLDPLEGWRFCSGDGFSSGVFSEFSNICIALWLGKAELWVPKGKKNKKWMRAQRKGWTEGKCDWVRKWNLYWVGEVDNEEE